MKTLFIKSIAIFAASALILGCAGREKKEHKKETQPTPPQEQKAEEAQVTAASLLGLIQFDKEYEGKSGSVEPAIFSEWESKQEAVRQEKDAEKVEALRAEATTFFNEKIFSQLKDVVAVFKEEVSKENEGKTAGTEKESEKTEKKGMKICSTFSTKTPSVEGATTQPDSATMTAAVQASCFVFSEAHLNQKIEENQKEVTFKDLSQTLPGNEEGKMIERKVELTLSFLEKTIHGIIKSENENIEYFQLILSASQEDEATKEKDGQNQAATQAAESQPATQTAESQPATSSGAEGHSSLWSNIKKLFNK